MYHPLKVAAKALDLRYWQREAEKSRANRQSNSNSNSSSTPKQSSSSTSNNNSSSSSQSKSKPKGKGQTSNSSTSNASASASAAPHLPFLEKLGTDGKLNADEKARRLKEGLCSYCGLGKHKVEDCQKKKTNQTAKDAKARAATVFSTLEKAKSDENLGN